MQEAPHQCVFSMEAVISLPDIQLLLQDGTFIVSEFYASYTPPTDWDIVPEEFH